MILLTGFEPFQGDSINPSKEIVLRLARLGFEDLETLILPVAFEKAFDRVQERLFSQSYDFVLMLGQAGGRKSIGFERIAINRIDTEVPDEEGQWWLDRKIVEGAPEAFISELPLRSWMAELRQKGHDVEISNSAGLFVCNSLYFQVCHKGRGPCLFVHVPYAEEQAKTPAHKMDDMTACILDLLGLIRR